MIHSILTEDTVEVNVEVSDWEKAVRTAGNLLYKNGYVEACYVDSMVDIVKTVGPYIVLLKGVALAHARPSQGAKKIGLSLITLKTPVNFGNADNDPVSLVFALSAVDNSSHLELLGELSQIFGDEEGMEELAKASTKQELLDRIHKIVKKTAVS
ncbi:MAG TPA: PTS sugar transporter subunit IIA [Candidatus Onthocola gallistercoris]|uniref:PTS sugar transporter subunit IIA n=1 Tax=Candidatus Onthocola gallistercoris TaxID=2840876 RepID=A0A9D1HGF4_9FIRM|nr:PTS sugar transporter subunit IIA [Candidatus Onthocola gallistercoris]